MKHFYLSAAFIISLICSPANAQVFWENINGPFSGNTRSVVTNSSGHIFAGIDGTGLFRSTDNGEHWTIINNGLTQQGTDVKDMSSLSGIKEKKYRLVLSPTRLE